MTNTQKKKYKISLDRLLNYPDYKKEFYINMLGELFKLDEESVQFHVIFNSLVDEEILTKN